MNATAASLWQLVRDDRIARRGAWAALAIVWLAAAWAELRILILLPLVVLAVYVLRRHLGEDEDPDFF